MIRIPLLTLALLFIAPVLAFANSIPTGYPNKGVLEKAVNLTDLIQKNRAILESVSPSEFQFGTQEMANALLEIGAWGAALQKHPVRVGDVSMRKGGKL